MAVGVVVIVAVAVGLVDQPLTGHDLAWWVCAVVGIVAALVLVYGGTLFI